MEYLKLFSAHTDYEDYASGGTMVRPNVSYCEDVKDVHYNPWTWTEEYLTTVALSDGTVSFLIHKNTNTDIVSSISYSIDEGETWITTNNEDNKQSNILISVTVEEGDKVLWKGEAKQFFGLDARGWSICGFESSCNLDVCGNVMSLLYGDTYKGKNSFPNDYEYMLKGYNLYGLFGYMENNNVIEKNVCKVVGASNLILPSTALTTSCYMGMFSDCTSLITAPKLLATTLAIQCYHSMFQGCTSLTSAPYLPATILEDECYWKMFDGCTSLNYIKAMFTTTPSNSYTYSWVSNVAASGTFVKNSAATWDVRGEDGIPNGWTVETA